DLSFDNHQLTGSKHVPTDNLATSAVGGSSDSVRSLAKCAAHFSDLTALCAHWSPHDQQRDSSSGWAVLFYVVANSTFRDSMVAPATGDQTTVSPGRPRRTARKWCQKIARQRMARAFPAARSRSSFVELLREFASNKQALTW